jgi:hypothetical protein
VIHIFEANNFVTKALIGDDATSRNLTNFVSYYPYDVLHICSHAVKRVGFMSCRPTKAGQTPSIRPSSMKLVRRHCMTVVISDAELDSDLWRLFALCSPKLPLCNSPLRNLDVTRS